MPIIEPIDNDTAEARGLGGIVESYAEAYGDPDAVLPRILGHAEGYAEALWGAMSEGHLRGGVDHRLKEIIRIQLANLAGDPYFSGLRSTRATEDGLSEDRIEAGLNDFEESDAFTDAEKWALRYAYLMYRSPESVDKAFYDEGKQHFTEAQIMELGGLIAVHYGMQVFMSTLPSDPGVAETH